MENKKNDPKKYDPSIHEQLCRVTQEAFKEYEPEEISVPEPDLSFLDDVTLKKKSKTGFGALRIAAAFVCIIALSSVIAVWMNSEGAYGGKTIMNNIKSTFNGDEVVTKNSSESKNDETGATRVVITEEKELDKAKDFLPGLYFPGYIPEGFGFSKLDMIKSDNGDYMATFTYKRGSRQITIGCMSSKDEKAEYGAKSDGSPPLELSDRKIYRGYDRIEKIHTVAVFFDSQLIDIGGNISREEMIKIAKGLELQKTD